MFDFKKYCSHCNLEKKTRAFSKHSANSTQDDTSTGEKRSHDTSVKNRVSFSDNAVVWVYDEEEKPISVIPHDWLEHFICSYPTGKSLNSLFRTDQSINISNKTQKSCALTDFCQEFETDFCLSYIGDICRSTLESELTYLDFYEEEKRRLATDIRLLRKIIPLFSIKLANILKDPSNANFFFDFFSVYINSYLRIKHLHQAFFIKNVSSLVGSIKFHSLSYQEKKSKINCTLEILLSTVSLLDNFERQYKDLLNKKHVIAEYVGSTMFTIATKMELPWYFKNVVSYYISCPLKAWKNILVETLVMYNKAVNTGVMLGILNNNTDVLKIFEKFRTPDILKELSLKCIKNIEKIPVVPGTASETLKYIYDTSNIVPNVIYDKSNPNKALQLNGTSVILSAVIKGDLHFSRNNINKKRYHASLLLTVIRQGRVDQAYSLLTNEFRFMAKISSKNKVFFLKKLLNIIGFRNFQSFTLIMIFKYIFSSISKLKYQLQVLENIFVEMENTLLKKGINCPVYEKILTNFRKKQVKGLYKHHGIVFSKCLEIVLQTVHTSIPKHAKRLVILQTCYKSKSWSIFKLLKPSDAEVKKLITIAMKEYENLNKIEQERFFEFISFLETNFGISDSCQKTAIVEIFKSRILEDYKFVDSEVYVNFLQHPSNLKYQQDSINFIQGTLFHGFTSHLQILVSRTQLEAKLLFKTCVESYLSHTSTLFSFSTLLFCFKNLLTPEDMSQCIFQVICFNLNNISISNFLNSGEKYHEVFEYFLRETEAFSHTYTWNEKHMDNIITLYAELLIRVKHEFNQLFSQDFGFIFNPLYINLVEDLNKFYVQYLIKEDFIDLIRNFHYFIQEEGNEQAIWFQGINNLIALLRKQFLCEEKDELFVKCLSIEKFIKANIVFKVVPESLNNTIRIKYFV